MFVCFVRSVLHGIHDHGEDYMRNPLGGFVKLKTGANHGIFITTTGHCNKNRETIDRQLGVVAIQSGENRVSLEIDQDLGYVLARRRIQ